MLNVLNKMTRPASKVESTKMKKQLPMHTILSQAFFKTHFYTLLKLLISFILSFVISFLLLEFSLCFQLVILFTGGSVLHKL